jgi:histidinol-phosphate aminotransferase
MIKKLNMYTIGPFGISATSLNAAIAAYQEHDYLQEALKKTMTSKQYLYDVLKGEGYTYIPSATNFVLFPIKMKGQRFAEEMMKRGVGIRTWQFNNQDWCRVSIGRMDEMQAFGAAFKDLS